MVTKILNQEEQTYALLVAMKLGTGEIHPAKVINELNPFPEAAECVYTFWMTFNDMTRRACEIIGIEHYRQSLERLYKNE